jgi:DNA segregation ATPase FtsK/SpoIIIE, S-DNA-T family
MRKEAVAIQRVLDAHKVGAQVLGQPHSFQSSALNVYRLDRVGGVAVAKVANLAPEIDEALTAIRGTKTRCRISPLPLRVEVPRKDAQTISIYQALSTIRAELGPPRNDRLLTLVGESVQSRGTAPYLLNLMSPNTPHVLIASTTGGGKTNLLLDMILSLANLNDARRLSIVALDPKGIDLHCLNGLPHLAGPVVRDAVDCVPVLQSVVDEMDRRKRVGKEPTHRIVVAIDEVADLMDVAGDEVAYQIKRIMQLGRGLGIHVIAATQKPSAEQVGSIIKANFPVRIVGAVASTTDATVAAGFGGTSAERLPGRGSFLIVKGGDVQSLQAYYADKMETAQRCGLSGKQNATFHPVWRYSTGQRQSDRSERVYHTTVPAYVPEDGPQVDQSRNTDFLPFGPLDRYGQSIVKTLYRQHGSKNAVIRAVWPNHRKQTCLEYLNPILEGVTQ